MTSILAFRVTPRSAKPGIVWRSTANGGDELEVRVAEAATGGEANEAVVKLLAKLLGISRSEARIISGRTSRHKRVAVPYCAGELRERLGAPTRKDHQ